MNLGYGKRHLELAIFFDFGREGWRMLPKL
ncbi:hypothetical protein CLV72_1011155 [Allonocardiopsis opalescens]|uniref:Uncharacterized protein n=1 Tax=Allonocardiopsis opalescens TaxID=1144618 RepID=A0A2T0QFC8_9ACTN|nr:hypothetical protein CLV72_1011155 [Allonocardiopsis opalescens]